MAEPNWEVIEQTTQEASRLLDNNQLTFEKLDELEKKATEAARGFGEVLEPFEQFRDALAGEERLRAQGLLAQ